MPMIFHRLRNEGNREILTIGAIAFAFNMLLVSLVVVPCFPTGVALGFQIRGF